MISYILFAELVFYTWQLWWLIADIVIVLLVLYAVSLDLIHMRQHELSDVQRCATR